MAGFTLTRPDVFAEGATVGAYPASNWATFQLPPSGVPVGAATATAVVTNGTLTFTGLTEKKVYYAATAGGVGYVRFMARDIAGASSWAGDNVVALSGPRNMIGGAQANVSGTLRLTGGMTIKATKRVSHIGFGSKAALSVLSNQWFCLVRASDRAVLGKTVDDGATAWAGDTYKQLALSTPYVATDDVDVYAGILVVATGMGTHYTTSDSTNYGAAAVALSPMMAGTSNTGLTDPASLGATVNALTINMPMWAALVNIGG